MAWCSNHGLPHSTLLSWSPEDRAKLMAHLLDDAARCSSCGTLPDEWAENQWAYEAVTIMCHGCAIKEAANEDAPDLPGTKVTLMPALAAERIRERPRTIPGRG